MSDTLASELSAGAWLVSVSTLPAAKLTLEVKVKVPVEAPAAKLTDPIDTPFLASVRVVAAVAEAIEEAKEPVSAEGSVMARGIRILPMTWLAAGTPGKNISRS